MSASHPSYPTRADLPGNGFAVAGLVCGLAALFVLWPVLGPLAVGFGSAGWSRANHGARRKGVAVSAVIIGLVAIVLWLLAVQYSLDDPRYFVW